MIIYVRKCMYLFDNLPDAIYLATKKIQFDKAKSGKEMIHDGRNYRPRTWIWKLDEFEHSFSDKL